MGKKNDAAKLELIGAMLEDIISIVDRTRPDTVALNLAIIKLNSRCALKALNEFKENKTLF